MSTVTDDQAWHKGRKDARAGREPDTDAPDSPNPFAYDEGYQAGLDQLAAEREPSSAAGPKASRRRTRRNTAPKSKGRSRSRSSRGRTRSRSRRKSAASKAIDSVAAPVRRQAADAISVLGLAIAIALLYNLLTHSEAAAGALGGLAAAVRWLDDPNKSIPYANRS